MPHCQRLIKRSYYILLVDKMCNVHHAVFQQLTHINESENKLIFKPIGRLYFCKTYFVMAVIPEVNQSNRYSSAGHMLLAVLPIQLSWNNI